MASPRGVGRTRNVTNNFCLYRACMPAAMGSRVEPGTGSLVRIETRSFQSRERGGHCKKATTPGHQGREYSGLLTDFGVAPKTRRRRSAPVRKARITCVAGCKTSFKYTYWKYRSQKKRVSSGRIWRSTRPFAASDFWIATFLIAIKNQIWSDQAVRTLHEHETYSFNFMRSHCRKDSNFSNCAPIALLVLWMLSFKGK